MAPIKKERKGRFAVLGTTGAAPVAGGYPSVPTQVPLTPRVAGGINVEITWASMDVRGPEEARGSVHPGPRVTAPNAYIYTLLFFIRFRGAEVSYSAPSYPILF